MIDLWGVCRTQPDIQGSGASRFTRRIASDLTLPPHTPASSLVAPFAAVQWACSHRFDPRPEVISNPAAQLESVFVFGSPQDKAAGCITEALASLGPPAPGRISDRVGPPFLGCILDHGRSRLSLISDPFGLYPLYYAWEGTTLLFSTEFSALLRSGGFAWTIDRRALMDFFTYEYVTGDKTLAETVKVLPPASVLQCDAQGMTLSSYADTLNHRIVDRARKAVDTARNLHDALLKSVERACAATEDVALPLSGGLDSRSLLGCLQTLRKTPRAFTFGVQGCRDVTFASRLASRTHLPHSLVRINGKYLPPKIDCALRATGGMVSCRHHHILSLADHLAPAGMLLDGLGGDALTGGHLRWEHLYGDPRSVASRLFKRHAAGCRSPDDLLTVFSPDALRGVDYDPQDAVRSHFLRGAPLWRSCHAFDIRERQRRFIQYGPLMMRRFVRVATPFYANGVTRLLLTAPLAHLLEQRSYLLMISRHLRPVATVPDTARGLPPSMPQAVRFGKKLLDAVLRRLPFGKRRRSAKEPTDYQTWLFDDLADYFADATASALTHLNGLLHEPTLRRSQEEHRSGQADHTSYLYCVMTLGAWMRYLNRAPATPPA